MDVTLNPELEKLIEDEVKSGRSANRDEFFNKAVYHYVVARDLGEEYTAEEIDSMIAQGLEDIERGDTIAGDEASANSVPKALNVAVRGREAIRARAARALDLQEISEFISADSFDAADFWSAGFHVFC